MPLIEHSTYRCPRGWDGGHRQTWYPTLFRRPGHLLFRRERVELDDGDFVDLDHLAADGDRTVILLHGLESSSDAPYVRGMARLYAGRGWNVVAMNLRGCSGEPNRLYRSYHSGASDDLRAVVRHLVQARNPGRLALIGFSLGGNILLKYLGEDPDSIPVSLHCAAAISVPCDLASCAARLAEGRNRVYMRRFARQMHVKARRKAHLFPSPAIYRALLRARTFTELDDIYTAPAHGFDGAEDYWRKCSSRFLLGGIRVPTLLIQSDDDPFLTPACFPRDEAAGHDMFWLERTRSGGHLGFIRGNGDGEYWHETRVLRFMQEVLGEDA